jgi:hypothetical protein
MSANLLSSTKQQHSTIECDKHEIPKRYIDPKDSPHNITTILIQPTESVLTLLLISVILLHLSVSPYTKVEESFNIQATHDILTYGVNLADPEAHIAENYDHVKFPGSVPRTFVGAVTLSFLANVAQMAGRVQSEEGLQSLGL